MAKKSYKRRYYRIKGRWSANIKNIDETQILPEGINGSSVDLCLNPPQNDQTVSQQYTVKNIELSVFLDSDESTGNVEGVEHYIMYVPQGMQLSTSYNLQHPEYIMAYYYQGNPTFDSTSMGYKLKIKTRLARRLQTGDKIVYLWKCQRDGSTNQTVHLRGLVRWWTKAN